MLNLNNIEVIYNNVILVLKGVSLKVPEGKIITLLGANGAGKTTTLKAISGLLHSELGEVTDGSIYFEENRIEKMDPEAIFRLGIVQILEGRLLFEQLTVEENIIIGSVARKDKAAIQSDMKKVYELFPKLEMMKERTSGYLSGGERQMLVIGRALMSSPKIMLLDEPSMGLSPLLVDEIFKIIKRINQDGTTILVVEQNASVALSVAEYGYVMEDGRIVMDGPSEKLIDNEDIKEFYLGLSYIGKRKSYREVKHYKRRKRWLA
jgi:branched-chain amino acid transport system ATP-binding protein